MAGDSEAKAVPQLTEAYHKARRNLAFCSGLLIVWEYIGISLGKPGQQQATAKSQGVDVTVSIQNPEAAPMLLLLLVLYFSLRLSVEWNQCDPSRRKNLAPRVDLATSYTIAVAAVLLFIIQQALQFRLADLFAPEVVGAFAFGVAIVVALRNGPQFRKFFDLHSGIGVLSVCLAAIVAGLLVIVAPARFKEWGFESPIEPLTLDPTVFSLGYFTGVGFGTLLLLAFEARGPGGIARLWQGKGPNIHP